MEDYERGFVFLFLIEMSFNYVFDVFYFIVQR